MRAGGYTVHQSLTAEAAAVLKMSLGLARRRGHAQVTPLHVAFTLLSTSSSSSSSSSCLPPHLFASSSSAAAPSSYAYGLLRRACVKSHPATAAASSPAASHSHPLRCRALELCFNVALNRLPTADVVMGGPQCSPLSSPSSSCASSASSTSFSASLIPHNPTLSNALVAALKRAQANQRRGCAELQNQLPLPPAPLTQTQQSSQQQPLLAIKVELDQLVVSILDDPSVSRVMREAGFSSPAVKSNIEEESAMLLGLAHHSSSSSSHAVAVPPQFFTEPYIDFPAHANGGGGSWPAQFLNQPGAGSSCKEEDVRAILEVMMRKQGRRTNPVVVGDSASVAEASVAQLMRRLDRGEVPDQLRGAHVLRLNLPYVHARLMTRADVDARVADLRRSVAGDTVVGTIIYVGDIRWAVCEDHDALADVSPVAHMVGELARLLAELRAAACGRVWLVAAASYRTYMRCQRRQASPLEAAWALQPVVVPAGAGNGLALGPHAPPVPAPSMNEIKINRLGEIPLLDHAFVEEEDVAVLCAECANSFEKEASAVRAKAEGTTLALTYFPGWPQSDEPQASHKDELIELKRKWSRSCQSLHLPSLPSNASPIPWWRTSSPKSSSAGLSLTFDTPIIHGTSKINDKNVQITTLSLLLPDSLTTFEEPRRDCTSEGLDGAAEPAVQESDGAICSGNNAAGSRQPWLGVTEVPFGHLKREAEGGLMPLGESKRRRHGGRLDLNLCADEEEGGGDTEGEQPAPSDLTNECESDGDDTGCHDDDDDGFRRHE